ncbi:MAG: NADH-quinone oxidoreductase subunit N, partial [Chloroflexi bacterium]|nr:NADH-quinone oxidoreductase subunit N [Chloroflexota bacterium]
YGYLKRMDLERGEYYVLMLFSISGMMLMAQAADLIVIFLALELLSIPLYVLAAFARPRADSEEAGLKYFLLGAFATGFVVYGIALVFGATANTSLAGIVSASFVDLYNPTLMLIGAALILVGFSFKVAAVPFHMWTPDVYQGAPTPVTGFMAVGAKAAGFAALLRVFVTAFPSLSADLVPVLWALAALTMVIGNLVAISQTNIKRMLAYSSIAHAGYILMAFVPYGQPQVMPDAVASALFYLVAYALTSFGAWSVVIALEKPDAQGLEISDYAGLGRRKPALAAAMTIFMLSLTGMPPTLGLVGKFYLFRTVIEGGFIGLAVIGVLTSLISAYYYLRVVVTMYMREGEPQVEGESWLNLTTLAAAVATVALSFLPAALFALASGAVLRLF